MKAVFGKKVTNIRELKEMTKDGIEKGIIGTEYKVDREISLSNEVFQVVIDDFLKEQAWISQEDGGTDNDGIIKCIRIINNETDEKVLINSEGYLYSRYIAIEE